jgi:hypothetical protein
VPGKELVERLPEIGYQGGAKHYVERDQASHGPYISSR